MSKTKGLEALESLVKLGLAAIAFTIGLALALWGGMLVVRGATDAYDSEPWVYYAFGAVGISAGLLFASPVLIFLARQATNRRSDGGNG
jgi:hypothetical protein